MAARRHRSSYKFTAKTHSKRGLLAFVMACGSIVVLVAVIAVSFRSGGNGSMYLGSAGVSAMLLGLAALVLALLSLGEENSYKIFPGMAVAAALLSVAVWAALYIAGFLG